MLSKSSHFKFPIVASLSAIAVTGIFCHSAPANAASVTYSQWLNVGPATVGDADNKKFSLTITDGADFGESGKILFQFTSKSLADSVKIGTVYFFDMGGLFTQKSTTVTATQGSKTTTTTEPRYGYVSDSNSDAIANNSSNSGLNFSYGTNVNFPQGNAAFNNLPNATFVFDGGGGKYALQTGETLGVLAYLAPNKTFVDVLSSLTQNSNLIIGAHLLGYTGGVSDGFYYGRASVKSGTATDSALTAGPNGTPLYYDSYGTTSDPNPATRPSPSPTPPPPGTAIPEPLTILGATTAAGLGATFKRRLRKAEK